MATFTVTIVDDVKESFEAAFAGQDLGAVMTGLMRQAIAERTSDADAVARRQAAVEAVLRAAS
jgi:hypothetical protein